MAVQPGPALRQARGAEHAAVDGGIDRVLRYDAAADMPVVLQGFAERDDDERLDHALRIEARIDVGPPGELEVVDRDGDDERPVLKFADRFERVVIGVGNLASGRPWPQPLGARSIAPREANEDLSRARIDDILNIAAGIDVGDGGVVAAVRQHGVDGGVDHSQETGGRGGEMKGFTHHLSSSSLASRQAEARSHEDAGHKIVLLGGKTKPNAAYETILIILCEVDRKICTKDII